MRKILLVNPPSPFLIDERVFPNLGLLNFATTLLSRGQDVEVLDLAGSHSPKEELLKKIDGKDIIGFSSTTPQFSQVYPLARAVKQADPSKYLLLGGAHASAMLSLRGTNPEAFNADPNRNSLDLFDTVFSGEAETLDLRAMPRGFVQGEILSSLDETPIADRGLYDILTYRYTIDGKKATTVMTQRGCPFKCKFCSGRQIDMYRKTRSLSPNRIVEELDYLNGEFGFEAFMWFDDELNINSERLKKLAGSMKQRSYIGRGFVRSDLLVRNPATLDYLSDMGFVELCSGVESGSDKILGNIGKGTTSEINTLARKLIEERGMRYKAFTILGHPGETREDVQQTRQWIERNSPDSFDIGILQPYPGSIIYDNAIPSRKFPGFDWEYNGLYFRKPDYSSEETFYKGRAGEYKCNVRTDSLSPEEIVQFREEIEKSLRK
ncbi:Radical SAM superfamily protein [uncultured archaeon]|nr:Radical SAM superfamily protein [uncultured archaeon]